MIDLFKEIDFSSQLSQNSEWAHFIQQACKKVEQQESEHLRKIKKPELDDELMNQFVVSGIPVIKTENENKFIDLFKIKLLGAKNIGEKNGLIGIIPGMQNGLGNQTLYLTYRTTVQAKAAFNKLNNLKFDANHRMNCVWVNELRALIEDSYQHENKDFKAPVFAESQDKIKHNLDEQFRNQFFVREDKAVYLLWLDYLDRSVKSALPTEAMPLGYQISKIVFSPLGNYMGVCANDGVHVYFGDGLKYKGLLRQANCIDAKFSPDERFLVTTNGNLSKNRQNFIIWALEEEVKIKSYRAQTHQNLDSFQFSDDASNLAIVLLNDITFYTLVSVEDFIRQIRAPEEEQHILKAVHIQKLAWLKSKNWVIVMCYELDYSPMSVASTRVFLYSTEIRIERKWRAWGEHAKGGEIFVSDKGEWVAIALRKFVKKGHFATVIQVANLLKKQDAIQISPIEFKQEVGNIGWDGYNNRIAVIFKDQSVKTINVRFNVAFFEISIKNKSLEINKIGEIGNNLQNRVLLASNGAFFALYNISEDSAERGKFSLGLITRETKDKGKRSFNFEFTKHDLMVNGMNFFQVDQSGRFVLLGTEKGYQIWNFIGELVVKDTLQKKIHDVQWRPRLFNKLSEEEERKLVDQEKEIRKKYELIDDKRINSLKYEKEAAKIKQKEAFFDFIARKQAWFKEFLSLREGILGFREFDVRTDKYEVEEGFIDLQ